MRRKDRQITDPAAIRALLDGQNTMHLSMTDGLQPYVVPMTYGYALSEEGQLVLFAHSALEGRKLDLLHKNPRVCVEISEQVRLDAHEIPCRWTTRYRSLIGEGEAALLEDLPGKLQALTALMRQAGADGPLNFEPDAVARIVALRIDIAHFTCKSNIPV